MEYAISYIIILVMESKDSYGTLKLLRTTPGRDSTLVT